VETPLEQFNISPPEADDLAAAHCGTERELHHVAGEVPPLRVLGVEREPPIGR